MLRTAVAIAAFTCASGAFGQSTSTTLDMGGGMTHVDTMGPNGAMTSSNCTNIGGGIATCNTLDLSRPRRNNPTPDTSRPQNDGTPLNFIGDLLARSQERSFQKKVSKMIADGDCRGAATFALFSGRETLSDEIHRYCLAEAYAEASKGQVTGATSTLDIAANKQVIAGTPTTPVSGASTALIPPSPMSLISVRPIPIPGWVKVRDRAKASSDKTDSVKQDSTGTEYTVNYLGQTFLLDGPNGMTMGDIRSSFENAWNDDPWLEYTSSGSGTVYYFNIQSVRHYSDRIEVWIKMDHSKDRTTKARSSKMRYEVKCDSQTIRVLQAVENDASGSVLSSSDTPDPPVRIVPETVGSALHHRMCKI